MILIEKVNEWFWEQEQKREQKKIETEIQKFAYYVDNKNYRAISKSINDNQEYPEISYYQAEILFKKDWFNNIESVMNTDKCNIAKDLYKTNYVTNMKEDNLYNLVPGSENPIHLLRAQYIILAGEYLKQNPFVEFEFPKCSHLAISLETDMATKILNNRMKQKDILAMENLEEKGIRPDDSVIIRHKLIDYYNKLASLFSVDHKCLQAGVQPLIYEIQYNKKIERAKWEIAEKAKLITRRLKQDFTEVKSPKNTRITDDCQSFLSRIQEKVEQKQKKEEKVTQTSSKRQVKL